MESQWIQNWLSLQDNPRTRANYKRGMRKFVDFCRNNHINGLETLKQDYRDASYDDDRLKLLKYTDAWNDVLQKYTIWFSRIWRAHHHSWKLCLVTFMILNDN